MVFGMFGYMSEVAAFYWVCERDGDQIDVKCERRGGKADLPVFALVRPGKGRSGRWRPISNSH